MPSREQQPPGVVAPTHPGLPHATLRRQYLVGVLVAVPADRLKMHRGSGSPQFPKDLLLQDRRLVKEEFRRGGPTLLDQELSGSRIPTPWLPEHVN